MKKTVIVCGMPRSGTRSVANILNASDQVLITAEFPSGVTNKLFALVAAMNSFFDKRAYKDKAGWEVKKAQLVHDVWLANSVFDGDLSKYNFIGNKTPSNELFFSKYEEVFEFEKPFYIYCVRSPIKVITSLMNMPWNKESPQENWQRWKDSFEIYHHMLEKAPGRVLLVSFDDKDNNEFYDVGDRIFKFLDVKVSKETEKKWRDSKPAQPKESVLNGKTPVTINNTDLEMIQKDKVFEALKENYGYLI